MIKKRAEEKKKILFKTPSKLSAVFIFKLDSNNKKVIIKNKIKH